MQLPDVTEEEEPNIEGDVVADLVADLAISTVKVKETSGMAYQACQANSACTSAVQASGACGTDGPCAITELDTRSTINRETGITGCHSFLQGGMEIQITSCCHGAASLQR